MTLFFGAGPQPGLCMCPGVRRNRLTLTPLGAPLLHVLEKKPRAQDSKLFMFGIGDEPCDIFLPGGRYQRSLCPYRMWSAFACVLTE